VRDELLAVIFLADENCKLPHELCRNYNEFYNPPSLIHLLIEQLTIGSIAKDIILAETHSVQIDLLLTVYAVTGVDDMR
jgi:hypothetical protein